MSGRVQTLKNKFTEFAEGDNFINKRLDPTRKYKVWYLIISVILLTCLSFLFYMVSVVDGALFGTPEGEIDSLI